MSVPFISNLGFTEVSTAGTLNTKAGSKDALPVQYYKLTADITGVLTINNTANHAKIILDMNNRKFIGYSPYYQELKGKSKVDLQDTNRMLQSIASKLVSST